MVTPGVSCSVVTALTDRNRVIRLERINESSVSEITDLAKNRNQSQECGGGGDFNQNDSNGPVLELFHFSLSELTPQKCLLQDTYGYIPHPLQGLLEQLP